MENESKVAGRREFDYQERWHGWKSPVGLGLFILLCGITIALLNISTSFQLLNISTSF
jgi:hypothetical protein